jgi:cytochrome c
MKLRISRRKQVYKVIIGLIPLALAASALSAQTSAPNAGRSAFAVCAACHATTPGTVRIGPTLHGVSGRRIARLPQYNYSPALKSKSGVWDDRTLDAFLANPREYAPGTKMAYAGVRDPRQRAALISYLKSLK